MVFTRTLPLGLPLYADWRVQGYPRAPITLPFLGCIPWPCPLRNAAVFFCLSLTPAPHCHLSSLVDRMRRWGTKGRWMHCPSVPRLHQT